MAGFLNNMVGMMGQDMNNGVSTTPPNSPIPNSVVAQQGNVPNVNNGMVSTVPQMTPQQPPQVQFNTPTSGGKGGSGLASNMGLMAMLSMI